VLAEGESLVVDPAISADEVARIDRRALERSPLTAEEALSVAEADLCYLRSLQAAVVEALTHDGTRDETRAAGLAVALPRECSPDLAEMRGFNVDRQIEEILPAS